MIHRPADIYKEPPRQKFGTIPRISVMLRVGGWMLTNDGLFRWTRYDFTASGKPCYRHDWRKIFKKLK